MGIPLENDNRDNIQALKYRKPGALPDELAVVRV